MLLTNSVKAQKMSFLTLPKYGRSPTNAIDQLCQGIAFMIRLKETPMKINLKGPESQRYREIRKVKQFVLMPDKRAMTHRPKIVSCYLTPRQQHKKMEMYSEGDQ